MEEVGWSIKMVVRGAGRARVTRVFSCDSRVDSEGFTGDIWMEESRFRMIRRSLDL